MHFQVEELEPEILTFRNYKGIDPGLGTAALTESNLKIQAE